MSVNVFGAINLPVSLVHRKGDDWRTSRHLLSPTFSVSKMKMVRQF